MKVQAMENENKIIEKSKEIIALLNGLSKPECEAVLRNVELMTCKHFILNYPKEGT